MEAPDHREDVVLAGDRERHAHGDLVRLRARDREVHDLEPVGQGGGDTLGEAHEMGVRVPGVLVPELAGLGAHDLHQLGMAVAQHVAHHAGGQVVVALAVDVVQPDAFAAFELNCWLVAPAEDARGIPRHQVGMGVGGRVGGSGVSHRGRGSTRISRRIGSVATAISFSICAPQPGQQNRRNSTASSTKREGSPISGLGLRDRAHVLQAGILVVGIERAEGGPAVAAGPVGAAGVFAHVERVGRAQTEVAVALRLRRRAVGEAGEAVSLDGGPVALGRLDIDGGVVLAQHRAEDCPRRFRRDVLVQQVVLDLRRVAPHGVAEAAAAGPAHRVDIRRVLVEVLLPQLQVLGPAGDLRVIVDHAALGHALQDVALADELVGVGGGGEAPHHAGRGGRRVARRQRVLGDALGVVWDEAGLGGEPAAVAAGAARIRQLLAVEHEQREVLLVVLHVGELADRRARLAAGVDAVGVRKGADGAADGVDQQVAVTLAPLVDAAK